MIPDFCQTATTQGFFKVNSEDHSTLYDSLGLHLIEQDASGFQIEDSRELRFNSPPAPFKGPVQLNDLDGFPNEKDMTLLALNQYLMVYKFSTGEIEYIHPTDLGTNTLGHAKAVAINEDASFAIGIYEVEVSSSINLLYFFMEKNDLTCHASCKYYCVGPNTSDCFNCNPGDLLILNYPLTGSGSCQQGPNCPQNTYQVDPNNCMSCSPDCEECTSEECTLCKWTKKMFEGACYEECPINTGTILPEVSTCVSCVTNPEACPSSPNEGGGTQGEGGEGREGGEGGTQGEGGEGGEREGGQDGCAEAEIKVNLNECVSCLENCDNCLAPVADRGNTCQVYLSVYAELPKFQNFYDTHDIVFDVFFSREGGKKIEWDSLVKQKIIKEDFQIKVKEKGSAEISYEFFWEKNNRLKMGLNFPDDLEKGERYTFEIKFGENFFQKIEENPESSQAEQTQRALVINYKIKYPKTPQEFRYSRSDSPSERDSNTVAAISGTVSESFKYSYSMSQVFSFIGTIFSFDNSGVMIKFSQISKIISRLRLIGVNFGRLQTSFLDGISEAFNSANRDLDLIRANGNGFKGKIDLKGVRIYFITFSKEDLLQNSLTYLYLLSWILKLTASYFLIRFKAYTMITENIARFIVYQKKIHFAFYHLNVTSVFFFGTRTMLHLKFKGENLAVIIVTYLIYFLACYDTVELAWVCMKQIKTPDTHKPNIEFKFIEEIPEVKVSKKVQRPSKRLRLTGQFTEEEIRVKFGNTQNAVKEGYSRRVDYIETLRNLEKCRIEEEFATSELRDEPLLFFIPSVLMASYCYLLRILAYQVIFIAVSHAAKFQIILLLAIEASYMISILINQSISLIIFLVTCLVIEFSYQNNPIPLGIQRTGIYSVFIGILIEYGFLIFNTILMIVKICKEYKEKKSSEKGDKGKLVVYLWVNQNLGAERRNLGSRTMNKVVPVKMNRQAKKRMMNKNKRYRPFRKQGEKLRSKNDIDEVNKRRKTHLMMKKNIILNEKRSSKNASDSQKLDLNREVEKKEMEDLQYGSEE